MVLNNRKKRIPKITISQSKDVEYIYICKYIYVLYNTLKIRLLEYYFDYKDTIFKHFVKPYLGKKLLETLIISYLGRRFVHFFHHIIILFLGL